MKVTIKLVISIIIISLLCLFCFELNYNKIMYKDYNELYIEYIQLEQRVDRVIDMNLKLTKYILKEVNYGN